MGGREGWKGEERKGEERVGNRRGGREREAIPQGLVYTPDVQNPEKYPGAVAIQRDKNCTLLQYFIVPFG